jgi:hypothetical protein
MLRVSRWRGMLNSCGIAATPTERPAPYLCYLKTEAYSGVDAVNVETFTVFLGNGLRDRGELAPRKANGKRRYAQQWPRQEWPAMRHVWLP